jgi:hypothetical protein
MKKITIKDYYAITELQKIYGEEENEYKLKKSLIKHFELEKLSIDETTNMIDNILKQITSESDFKLVFEYKGKKYGFIPNLEKITTAEWIDIEFYQNSEDNLHRLMSIFYRPITKGLNFWTKKYEIQEYNGTHTDFIDLPIEYYKGLIVFFYHLKKVLSKDINMSIN